VFTIYPITTKNNYNIFAAVKGNSFADSYVLDDLEVSTLNGERFDITQYPYDENGELKVINFVEYGYSFKSYLRYDYGLYIYIYNPQGLNIDISSLSNKIEMATLYFPDGSPADYTKFNIK
jgi:hypothetical protein